MRNDRLRGGIRGQLQEGSKASASTEPKKASVTPSTRFPSTKDSLRPAAPPKVMDLSPAPSSNEVRAPQRLSIQVLAPAVSEVQRAAITARENRARLDAAILGATRALDSLQIRDRPGKQSSEYDYSGPDGEGAASRMKVGKHFVPSHLPVTNEEGGWASYIHFGTQFVTGKPGMLPVGFTDSNLFVTAFTSYPLFLIDDSALPEAQQFVRQTLELSTKNIEAYRRGSAYSFWQSRPDGRGNEIVGMRGVPPSLLRTLAKIVTSPTGTSLVSKMRDDTMGPMKEPLLEWLNRSMSPEHNPIGIDALLNIPNDADDTAVAAAHLRLQSRTGDPEAIQEMCRFRDESPDRMSWVEEPTGAISVWLRDPKAAPFSDPNKGDLSGGMQVLDEVVNANAVFALALHGQTDAPGCDESIQLIERSAREKHWQKESVYYPNRMVFPYAVSRAYRDGGARDPRMRNALKLMLADVLDLFDGKTFASGIDKTTSLSTAYGALFLLNTGEALAKEAGLDARYREVLEGAIGHLLESSENLRLGRRHRRDNHSDGLVWEEGVFFSSGPSNAVMWDSRAQTTATVLEALTKYRLGYDHGDSNLLESPRLVLK